MKVCILTTSFPRFKGDSAGIFLYHLSRWLVKKGIKIEIIAPHDPGCHFTEKWEGIRIHRFPYFYPFGFQSLCYRSGIVKNIKNNHSAILQLPFLCASEFLYSLSFFKKNKPDIIHAHWTLPQGLIGIIAKGILKIPCVTTIHGSDVFGLRSNIFRALNRVVIRNSDACTANSKATGRIARQGYNKGNIRVVPMGVDTDDFLKTHDIASLKRKFKVEGPVILFVGRLIDLKGTAFLIKAVPAVIQRFPAAKTFVIGSGPQKAELTRLADSLNVANHIVFMDEVPQDELVPFYSMADVFVLPSIINENGETEGLGVVLLEAMACQTPVVGSNVGGIQDIIHDGITGLLANQKDSHSIAEKINILLSDTHLRQNIIKNGLRLVKESYSWEVISDRFILIYEDAINEYKRAMRA